jgi:hypothetical protein
MQSLNHYIILVMPTLGNINELVKTCITPLSIASHSKVASMFGGVPLLLGPNLPESLVSSLRGGAHLQSLIPHLRNLPPTFVWLKGVAFL